MLWNKLLRWYIPKYIKSIWDLVILFHWPCSSIFSPLIKFPLTLKKIHNDCPSWHWQMILRTKEKSESWHKYIFYVAAASNNNGDKVHLWKPQANIICNHERWNAISLRSDTRQGCLLLSFLFNIEVLASAIGKTKQNKNPDCKASQAVKLCLFTDNIIVYVETTVSPENPKWITNELLELRNETSKIAEHKIQ